MSRPARMLLVLALAAVAGVTALGLMAGRYAKLLERSPAPAAARPEPADEDPARARELVAGFATALERLEALGPERLDEALATSGLSRESFARVEALYRAWRARPDGVPPAFRRAFALEGGRLRRVSAASR